MVVNRSNCRLRGVKSGEAGREEWRLGGGTPRWYGMSDDLSLAISWTPGSVYPRSVNCTPFLMLRKTQRWP